MLRLVRFVIKSQPGNIQHVQLFHDVQNGLFMLLMMRIAGVNNMDQQIDIFTLFQCGFKARYQLCRQILNEANCVRQRDIELATEVYVLGRGI